jgi:hypothetical protein
VRATVTEGEDYELIDRYLERAIAETRLDTIADLARFLALDEVIVDRAMRFLTAIEHVRGTGGRFALTELGVRRCATRSPTGSPGTTVASSTSTPSARDH